MLVVGAICATLFAAFYLWQTPGILGGALTSTDIDRYVARVAALNAPAEDKASTIARIRGWAAADDGQPVYMLNLMRYYPQLRTYPGAPDFQGTPQESNTYYESIAKKILLKSGSYPLIGGETQGRDILDAPAALDDWNRVLVIRYRNRRAFLELLTDPAYGPVLPYKLMALQVVLVPVRGDLVVPDLRWLAAALGLMVFLGTGWLRAARTLAAESR
jgi:hypothetical protein